MNMKSKERRIIYSIIICVIISLLNVYKIDFQNQIINYDKNITEIPPLSLKSSGYWYFIDTTFYINGYSSTNNWTWAESQDWCSGSGSSFDPYIIENITFVGAVLQANIWIMDTSEHFIIRNCTFIDTRTGIELGSSDNGKLINNTFSNSYGGIDLNYCELTTVYENIFNDISIGLFISGGINNNISKNKFFNNRYGIRIWNYADDNLFYANYFEDNSYGINFWSGGGNNNFSKNIMNGCGFLYYYWSGQPILSNIIETSNLVNGKPLYYYEDELNLGPNNFTNAGQVILIKCNNSQVSHLNLSYSTLGISLILCKNNTLANLNCSFNFVAGIMLEYCINITLDNNLVTYNDFSGIYLYLGGGYNLTNNQMMDCGIYIDGDLEDFYLNNVDTTNEVNNRPIYYIVNQTGLDASSYPNAGQLILIDCNNSLITDLELYNTSSSILAYYSYNNVFTNINSTFNYDGIIFRSCSNNIILDTNMTYNRHNGILIDYKSHNNTLSGNMISNNERSGLSLQGDYNSVIDNDIINNNYDGIYLNGIYNNITDNVISHNKRHGIGLGDSYNRISKNNITHNTNNGLDGYGNFHIISENNISNNENHGIYMDNANEYTISGNLISENEGNGILANYWSDNNDFIGNDIKFNEKFGIAFHTDTHFNILSQNNFTGNIFHVEDNGTLNVWYSGGIGNYWDDYIGADDNDDGIGDTPYTNIGGTAGSQDLYPIYWDPPAFSIISPIDNQMFGKTAPEFIIEIEKGVPDSMWYILNNLSTKYFFTSNNTIDQGAWDTIIDDTLTITFFISDSRGKTVYNEVVVRKDNINPVIIINSPHQNEEFGETSPNFDLLIIDDFLDEIWYTLNDGITNHSCGLSGQINQTLWDILPEGTYNLRFYASDTSGNVGYSDVIIIKTAPSIVPGFDILIIFLTIIVSMVSISWQIRKER